ncbi:cytochrome P450 [Spinellus fusiger]|nr:cytochrome P450 [Spinellus fusiger]
MVKLMSSPQLKMHEWHKELGPIIHIKMGVQDFILISDPKLAHKIFVTNGNITSSRPNHSFIKNHYTYGGRGVAFSQNGKNWTKARTAATTFLAPKVVNEFKEVLFFEAENLVGMLMAQTKSKKNVNPYDDIICASLNVKLSQCSIPMIIRYMLITQHL